MGDLWTEKENILNEVLDSLEKRYLPGLYDWLYSHDRGTYDEINRIEDTINESFLNGGPIPDFKAILREFWRLHIEAIKSFKKRDKPDLSLNEVRAERIRELESARL